MSTLMRVIPASAATRQTRGSTEARANERGGSSTPNKPISCSGKCNGFATACLTWFKANRININSKIRPNFWRSSSIFANILKKPSNFRGPSLLCTTAQALHDDRPWLCHWVIASTAPLRFVVFLCHFAASLILNRVFCSGCVRFNIRWHDNY